MSGDAGEWSVVNDQWPVNTSRSGKCKPESHVRHCKPRVICQFAMNWPLTTGHYLPLATEAIGTSRSTLN